MKKEHPNTSTPSSNTVTIREKAIEWYDDLNHEDRKGLSLKHFNRLDWHHLTDEQVLGMYNWEHPEQPSKEQSSNRKEGFTDERIKHEYTNLFRYLESSSCDLRAHIICGELLNNHLSILSENKRLKEERQILLDALRPLAELDLEGVNTSLDGNVVYQRNKTYINVGDVYKAREALKQVTK